jgi:hypothetical protein
MNWELVALIATYLLPLLAVTINYAVTLSGPLSISMSRPLTSDGGSFKDPTIPKGYTGTLTTRTDANTGTVTLAGGHGITTGDKVDIYWAGGVQYNVTVGTVATNSMPFDLGIGDNLPIATTAVVVSKRVEVSSDIDGDVLAILGMKLQYTNPSDTSLGHIDFHDAAGDEIVERDLVANLVQVFDIASGAANPFTGDPIVKCFVSNASSTNDAKFLMQWLQDSTP